MRRKKPPEKNRGGRPRKYDLEVVAKLCRDPCPDIIIADRFGVTLETVERWRQIPEFQAAVRRGEAMGRLELKTAMMELALGGNFRVLKFLSKKHLGMTN